MSIDPEDKTFQRSEDGAVTVDWIVLTAATAALAIGTYALIQSAVVGVNDMGMSKQPIASAKVATYE